MANPQFQIVEGPSKFNLMLALFDGKEVQFTLREFDKGKDATLNFHIRGIEQEDGSSESWIIKGSYYIPDIDISGVMRTGNVIRFDGFYETRTRKGWVK